MKEKDSIPYGLIAKQFSDKLSDEEQLQLNNYLAKAENKDEFDFLEDIWDNSDSEQFEFDTDEAFTNVKTKIRHNTKNKAKIRRKIIYSVAAVMLVFLVISYFYKLEKTDKPTLLTQYETNASELKTVNLVDGTVVSLNENSKLIVSENFNRKQREVTFSGEAYFEVAHNSNKPFIIKTHNSKIEVIGTEFNVNTISRIQVNLTKGKVKFTDVKNDKSLYLADNEVLMCDSKLSYLEKFTVHNRNYMAWKTGILKYDNQTIDSVAISLQKYYKLDTIIVQESVQNIPLTAKFDNLKIDEALKIISLTLDIQVKIKNNQVYFEKK